MLRAGHGIPVMRTRPGGEPSAIGSLRQQDLAPGIADTPETLLGPPGTLERDGYTRDVHLYSRGKPGTLVPAGPRRLSRARPCINGHMRTGARPSSLSYFRQRRPTSWRRREQEHEVRLPSLASDVLLAPQRTCIDPPTVGPDEATLHRTIRSTHPCKLHRCSSSSSLTFVCLPRSDAAPTTRTTVPRWRSSRIRGRD